MKRGIVATMMAAILCVTLTACVTGKAATATPAVRTWQETAKASYVIAGQVIQTANNLLPLAKVTLASEDYQKVVDIITKAKDAHVIVGGSLEFAIAVHDTTQKDGAMAACNVALKNLAPLVTDLSEFIVKVRAKPDKQV